MRADRLKEIRQIRGFSQPDLAQRIGISAQQIYRLEAGRHKPSSDIVTSLARELEVSADYLLGLVDEPVGYLREENLTSNERRALSAFRNGKITELLKLIADVSEKQDQASIISVEPTIQR